MALYLEGKPTVDTNELSPKEATQMSHDVKYIGIDVHKEASVIAVLNGSGKLIMETILETKASSLLQFLHGLCGELHVTLEEGTWAAWLYDVLQPHVQEVVVCNPRRNALLKEGSKSDKVDARKLADLLRTGMLRPVYHGENGLRTLRELARSYQTIGKDLTRVMNRLKALYRGWGIPCAGTQIYAPRHREEWLNKLPQAGVRRRGAALSTAGWIAGLAAKPATRTLGREPET
jgi:transposase